MNIILYYGSLTVPGIVPHGVRNLSMVNGIIFPSPGLYHCLFPHWTDRNEILPALRMGETIADMREGKSTVISAVTFLATESSVVILFLSTLEYYWMTGMASFLFSLPDVPSCALQRTENKDSCLFQGEEKSSRGMDLLHKERI